MVLDQDKTQLSDHRPQTLPSAVMRGLLNKVIFNKFSASDLPYRIWDRLALDNRKMLFESLLATRTSLVFTSECRL